MEELTVGTTFADHEIVASPAAARWASSSGRAHPKLGRDVALKVIAPELSEDREFRIRFRREYEAEVSIRHPNVVRVYGAGAKDGPAVRDDAVHRGLRPRRVLRRGRAGAGAPRRA